MEAEEGGGSGGNCGGVGCGGEAVGIGGGCGLGVGRWFGFGGCGFGGCGGVAGLSVTMEGYTTFHRARLPRRSSQWDVEWTVTPQAFSTPDHSDGFFRGGKWDEWGFGRCFHVTV